MAIYTACRAFLEDDNYGLEEFSLELTALDEDMYGCAELTALITACELVEYKSCDEDLVWQLARLIVRVADTPDDSPLKWGRRNSLELLVSSFCCA